MPASDFFINELEILGGTPPTTSSGRKGKYEVFRWNAKHKSIPRKPWAFGVHLRTAREDYSGTDNPTEQILGPSFTPFTLNGVWDDRYNISETAMKRVAIDQRYGDGLDAFEMYRELGGFAVREWKRFESMVQRGNPVRISFESIVVEGIITDFNVSYEHKARIGYEFTMSPHHRKPGGFFRARRSPRQALNARQLLEEVNREVSQIETVDAAAPVADLVGTIYVDVEDLVLSLSANMTTIEAAIDQRNLTPTVEPNASLLRIASQFYTASTIAQSIILELDGYDSSEALAYESGAGVLNFDHWARELMYRCRRIIVAARRAAADLQQRANPNAIALYTPRQGESLYSVSNRFYQTPHQWRRISERNRLTSFTLSGAELLVIPEVTTR